MAGVDVNLNPLGLARHRARDRNKRRAEPFDAGKILVARGLVDLSFATQFSFQRLNRHTGRHGGAVATPFADLGVDIGTFVRVHPFAPFAQAAAFSGAGLVVNHDRHAGLIAQFFLNDLKFGPRMQRYPAGDNRFTFEFLYFVGNEGNAFHPFAA